jgi:hypothetical protein
MKIKLLMTSILFCAVINALTSANPRDTLAILVRQRDALKKEIAAIDRNIKRTDSVARAENARFIGQKKRMEEELLTKEKENATLVQRFEELEAEVQRLSSKIDQCKNQDRSIISRRSYLTRKLTEECSALETIISRSIPWDREKRLARVTGLKNDLMLGSASLEDGLSRLLSLIQEAISFGDDIVLEDRSIRRNNGTAITARTLRIGNLWMVYVDQAEQNYGVLYRTGDSTYAWREDLSFNEREEIRMAIRVKEQKKAPQIVTLPLMLGVEVDGGSHE